LDIAQKILGFLFKASCDMQIITESSIDKNGLKRNLDAQLDGNLDGSFSGYLQLQITA